jgi:hypothetical protein
VKNDSTATKGCGFHAQLAPSLLTNLSRGSLAVFVVMAITYSNQRPTRLSHALHVGLDINVSMEAGVNVAKEKQRTVQLLPVAFAALVFIINLCTISHIPTCHKYPTTYVCHVISASTVQPGKRKYLVLNTKYLIHHAQVILTAYARVVTMVQMDYVFYVKQDTFVKIAD